MGSKRIVVTGAGVIAPNAIGKDAFFEAVGKGVSGIKPISLFDVSPYRIKVAGEIRGFKSEDFLGVKGLRILDRSTRLVSSACKLALDDAGIVINEENSADAGMALGTTLGSIKSIMDFDTEALKEGPHYVNPALFPNTVINSPASQASIKFNIKGFNVTISTGFNAGLDAIGYAVDALKNYRAKFVLAGGVEELCLQLFLGFYKSVCSGEDVILGEGAAVFVLEDLDCAFSRKAKIYAEITGYENSSSGNTKETTQQAILRTLIGETYSASGAFRVAAGLGAIEKQKSEEVFISTSNPDGSSSSLVISRYRG